MVAEAKKRREALASELESIDRMLAADATTDAEPATPDEPSLEEAIALVVSYPWFSVGAEIAHDVLTGAMPTWVDEALADVAEGC